MRSLAAIIILASSAVWMENCAAQADAVIKEASVYRGARWQDICNLYPGRSLHEIVAYEGLQGGQYDVDLTNVPKQELRHYIVVCNEPGEKAFLRVFEYDRAGPFGAKGQLLLDLGAGDYPIREALFGGDHYVPSVFIVKLNTPSGKRVYIETNDGNTWLFITK